MFSTARSTFYLEAPSLERLFISSALKLVDDAVGLKHVSPLDRHTLSVNSDSIENLLLIWLNEVIQLFNSTQFLPRQIYFNGFDGKVINAILMGEKHDPIRHGHLEKMPLFRADQIRFRGWIEGDNSFSLQLDKETPSPLSIQAV